MFSLFFEFFQNIYHIILRFFYQQPKTLEQLTQEHDVAYTAFLTNFWKDNARQKQNWTKITIQPGHRPKDLYKDSYLGLFVNEAIAQEAKQRLDQRMWLPLATRTKYFRKTISAIVKNHQIKQVVLLGSGFDTLAVRKKKYPVQFFEIDHVKILACKESIYQENGVSKNAQYIGMDYTRENFIQALIDNGLNPEEATFVLWEGNTFYLEKEMVLNIIQLLNLSLKYLFLSFDFMHPKIEEEKVTLDAFAKKQSPFKTFFSVEDVLEICQRHDLQYFSHFTTDELATNYGIDMEPYHTAKPYSVITVQSKNIIEADKLQFSSQ